MPGTIIEHSENGSPTTRSHFVQFYERDDFLVESVSTFLAQGLRAGEAVIVIATPAHRAGVRTQLIATGHDVLGLEKRGMYIELDAAGTLSRFMVDGSPEAELFDRSVGDLVRRTLQSHGKLRAFGEMVALLWADNNREAAIRLEELWNQLGKNNLFSLFCAYPVNGFHHANGAEQCAHVCDAHSRVLPSERILSAPTDDQRLRQIAQLEHKAAALEIEISRRAAAEEALRASEERLTQLLALMPAAVYTCDAEGRITYFNCRAAELWGREPALGICDQKWCGSLKLWLPDGSPLPHDQTPMAAAVRDGVPIRNREVIIERPGGSRVTVMVNIDPLFTRRGERSGAINVFQDITDLKESQERIRQGEEGLLRLGAIVDSSDDAIVSKDLNGVVRSWNKGAERIFGYTAEEMIGKPITVLMPPERVSEEHDILERIRRGERVDHYETVRRRKDGALLDISLTVSPIKDANGKIIGASKVGRDITERVRAKEELEQIVAERTAQLREMVAELEGFSYSVAHDMRAPLRAMNSYARFLEDDFGAALPSQGREFARRIAASATRLDALITDVLNYSRIARAEMPLDRVDVEQLTRDIVESYPDLRESGATILIQSPIPPVTGNAAALTQCISNLLSNAVKFVAPGKTPHVLVWAEKRPDCVTLWVEDNGVGISEEGQKRIFRMFQRLHPAREFDGTGIGLTIARKAVERMGGRVGVESNLGVGSRFWVELKRAL